MSAPPSWSSGLFTRVRILILVSLILTLVQPQSSHLPPLLHKESPRTQLNLPSWTVAHLITTHKPALQASANAQLTTALSSLPHLAVDWPLLPAAPYNASKVALLIEPRPLPHLVPHLLHMIAVVPRDWRFIFLGSTKSVLHVHRALATQAQIGNGKLKLVVMPEGGAWDIESKEGVYRALTNKRFYGEVLPGVEWLLKFESDSIMCANSNQSLDDWLEYSWAGATRYAELFSCLFHVFPFLCFSSSYIHLII